MSKIKREVFDQQELRDWIESRKNITAQIKGKENGNHKHAQLTQQSSKDDDLRTIGNRENINLGNIAIK